MKSTIVAITGSLAANGQVMPVIFVDPVPVNKITVSRIPVTVSDLETLAIGQEIEISRPAARSPLIIQPVAPAKDMPFPLSHCPQCTTPLVRAGSELFCPANCQNLKSPPDYYEESAATTARQYSIDPLLYQFIAVQNNARLFHVSGKQYMIFYNDPLDLTRIGLALGQWAKKMFKTPVA